MKSVFSLLTFCVVCFSTAVNAQDPEASVLACDEDQLSEECIQCLLPLYDITGAALGVCYEGSLPEGLNSEAFSCPSRLSDLQQLEPAASALLRDSMLANEKVAQALRPFEATDETDCELLPPEQELLSFWSQGESGSDISSRTQAASEQVSSCLKKRLDEHEVGILRLPGSKRLFDRYFALSDALIDLEDISTILSQTLVSEEILKTRIDEYTFICQFD